ncbi:MAG: hypothetical protein LVS60_10705 [Nodosilinea sp. LVE1205-7]|jgi:hypothetical protein
MNNSTGLLCPSRQGILPKLPLGSADMITAALVPAYLLGLLAGNVLAEGLDQLGYLSEQILQGRRLPILKIHDRPAED